MIGAWVLMLTQAVVFQEGFEDGALPAGWTIGNGGDAATWTVDTAANYFPSPPNADTFSVFLNLSVAQDDTLSTPVIPLDPASTNHVLWFDLGLWGEATPSGETLSVLVRTYAGGAWSGWMPAYVRELADLAIETDTVPLSISGSDSVQFAFRAFADGNAILLGLDNITLEATLPGVTDAAVRSILSPQDGQYVPVGSAVPVEVSVENLSAQAQSFSVTFTIRDVATSQVVFQETQNVSGLPAGETTVVVFSSFTPAAQTDFIGEAVVQLGGDVNPGNDTLAVAFSSVPYFGSVLAFWVLPDTTFIRVANCGSCTSVYLVRTISVDTAEVVALDPGTGQITPLFQVAHAVPYLSGFAVEGPGSFAFAWLDLGTGQTTLERRDGSGSLLAQHTDPRAVVSLDDAPGSATFFALVDPDLSTTGEDTLMEVTIASGGLFWSSTGEATPLVNFLPGASVYRYDGTSPWYAYTDIFSPSFLKVSHPTLQDSVSLGSQINDVTFQRVDIASIPADSVFGVFVLQADTLKLVSVGTYWGVDVAEGARSVLSPEIQVRRGQIVLTGSLPSGMRVTLLDMLGRVVFQGRVLRTPMVLPLQRQGVFFLRLEGGPSPARIRKVWIP